MTKGLNYNFISFIHILFYINEDYFILICIIMGTQYLLILPTPPHISNKQKGKYHIAVTSKKDPFY